MFNVYGVIGQAERSRRDLQAKGWVRVPDYCHQVLLNISGEFPGCFVEIGPNSCQQIEFWADPDALRAYRVLLVAALTDTSDGSLMTSSALHLASAQAYLAVVDACISDSLDAPVEGVR